MPYCVVWGCKSDSSIDKTFSWFRFPKDQPRFKAWVHYCKHLELENLYKNYTKVSTNKIMQIIKKKLSKIF